MPFDAYNLISGGGDYDLYYTSGVNFYGYSLETETAEKLFSWISCDVDSNELALVNVSDDGTISGFTGGYDDKAETYNLDYVTAVSADCLAVSTAVKACCTSAVGGSAS